MYELEPQSATFQGVFSTELRDNDLYLNNRIRKERRPPPNFLPSIRISENSPENAGYTTTNMPIHREFKPSRLKPTRSPNRRVKSLYENIKV